MAKKKKCDYFGLGRVVSLIMAIILPVSAVCGIITRFQEGKIVAGIIRIFIGWNLMWIIDLVSMILTKKIFRLLNI